MNSFLRRVKGELDKRRLAKSKYYLVSVRAPDSVEYCRAIGLDLETWLQEGLADILITSSYLQFNDWEYSAKLAHQHGVPVYPSLDESRFRGVQSGEGSRLPDYYGRVMNVWDAGCEGVFLFNQSGFWNMGRTKDALLATVKGRAFVNTLSKRYYVSYRGVGTVAGGALPFREYIKVPTLNHDAPIVVEGGRRVEVPIRLSDDLEAASAQGKRPLAVAGLIIAGDPKALTVTLNGKALEVKLSAAQNYHYRRSKTECALNANVPVEAIRRGANLVGLEAKEKVSLLDLWVDIDYPK